MKDIGLEVEFNSSPSDHECQVWRKSLHDFASGVFKKFIFESNYPVRILVDCNE
jgi:hypothetical protein